MQWSIGLLALYIICFSYGSSFRIPDFELHAKPSLNLWIITVISGIALGVASYAMLQISNAKLPELKESIWQSPCQQVRYYSVLVIGLLTFFLTLQVSPLIHIEHCLGKYLSASFVAVLGVLIWNAACKFMLRKRLTQTLLMTLILLISFFISVADFLFMSIQTDTVLALFNYLSGNLSVSSMSSSWSIALLSVLTLTLIFMVVLDIQKEFAALVLFGVAISQLGAIFFVGLVSAKVAILMNCSERAKMVFSALIATGLIVFSNDIFRLWFGGYSPPLMITSALLLMPMVVVIQMLDMHQETIHSSGLEQTEELTKGPVLRVLEVTVLVAFVLSTVTIIWHLGNYAQEII